MYSYLVASVNLESSIFNKGDYPGRNDPQLPELQALLEWKRKELRQFEEHFQ